MFRPVTLRVNTLVTKANRGGCCWSKGGVVPSNTAATRASSTDSDGAKDPSSSSSSSSSKPRRANRRRRLGLNGNGNTNDSIPSYKEFVHRWTVVSMYRNFLCAIRSLPSSQEELKIDLKLQVQKEFQAHKRETDNFSIQRALAEGARRYQELLHMVPKGHATTSTTSSPSGDDVGSWLNIQDPDDPRGRVGTGWPWDEPSPDEK